MKEKRQVDCLSDAELNGLLVGRESEASQQAEAHIQHCDACQDRLSQICDGPTVEQWRQLAQQDEQLPDAASRETRTLLKDPTSAGTATPGSSVGIPALPGYEIMDELGSGGMGVVYRARHLQLQRLVAVKVLAGAFARQPERWLRFQNEAKAAARLQHPNIVQVFEYGDHQGTAYVCQELADGGTLNQRLGRQPMPPREAAETVRTLSKAVAHAHDNGVLHRDLKPSNVLCSSDTVKLADFGLAKLLDNDAGLTQTEDVLGTPNYIAPEQVGRHAVDLGPTVDVYGLGAILYETLTAVPPFRGETSLATLQNVVEQTPISPRQLQPAVPRDLETICLKCLEKEPARRYQTATELTDELSRFLDGRSILARPTAIWRRTARWAKRRPAAASLIAVSAVATLLLLGMWARFTEELADQRSIANQKAADAEVSLAEQIESNAAANEVLEFLTTGLFDAAIPEKQGIDLTVIEVLENADKTIDKRFHDRPKVEAAVRSAMGNSYLQLGQPLRAINHLERSVALYDELNDATLADSEFDAKHAYAICLKSLNRSEEARAQLSDLMEPHWEQSDEKQLDIRFSYSDILLRERSFEEARTHLEELLGDCQRVLGDEHKRTLGTMGELGVLHFKSGDIEEAYRIFKQELESCRLALGEDDRETFAVSNNVAISLVRLGRFVEAEALHRDTLERKTRVFGAKHYSTIGSKHNLAMVVWRQDRFDEATSLLVDVAREKAETLGATDRRSLETLYQLGRMYEEMDAFEEGPQVYKTMIAPIWSEYEPTGQWASITLTYAHLLFEGGEHDVARELAQAAKEMLADEKIANADRRKRLEVLEARFAADATERGLSQ